MQNYLIAAPLVVLMAGAASAQTQRNSSSDDDTRYGTVWSQSVGDMFYSDMTTRTMRTEAEIAAAWAALTQTDRDMVAADCVSYKAKVEAAASAGSDAGSQGESAALPEGAPITEGGDAAASVGADAGTQGESPEGSESTGQPETALPDVSTTAGSDAGTQGESAATTEAAPMTGNSSAEMKVMCDMVAGF